MAAPLPWMIEDARNALAASSAVQRANEEAVKEAYKTYAISEEAYRKALALKITELRAEGSAATTAADLARGDTKVAALRRIRDIAEGVKDATTQAAWRASSDRKDAQALAEWSMRRELAEGAGREREPVGERPIGARGRW
jgi:hypothetical protein